MFRVVLCVPTRTKPHRACVEAMEKSIPLVMGAGYDVQITCEVGNPYISGARANMIKRGLSAKGDIFITIDDDVSWEPEALLKLVETEGEVVAGTYRCKEDEPNYMGRPLVDEIGRPKNIRADGCIEMACAPAGFLKITKEAIDKFAKGYPHLCYGPAWDQSVDLFNHGAHQGLWFGEDYAFCRNWRDIGGKVWCIPNIDVHHNSWTDDRVWRGNYHEYLMAQPGGKNGVPLEAS